MDKSTVLVADDHPLLRSGIVNFLEKQADLEVVGQAADGEEAVRLASELSPHVVIMDVEMPKVDGLEATRQIKAIKPEAAVLVLTVHDDEEHVAAFFEAGAVGYLLKSSSGEELVQAIRAVRLGEIVLDAQVMRKALENFAERSQGWAEHVSEKLSASDVEVLRLVAQGMTNSEMTKALGVGLRRVKSHLSEIFSKLGVESRTGAILACLREGVLCLDDLPQSLPGAFPRSQSPS